MTTQSMILWAGVLAVAGLALSWWDVVDFLLDRVGPPRSGPSAAQPRDDLVHRAGRGS